MLLVADVVAPRRRAMTEAERALFGIDKLNVPRTEPMLPPVWLDELGHLGQRRRPACRDTILPAPGRWTRVSATPLSL